MAPKTRRKIVLATTGLTGIALILLGKAIGNPWTIFCGGAGLVFVASRWWRLSFDRLVPQHRAPAVELGPAPTARSLPADPTDTHGLVEVMVAQGRFALLLRPQLAERLPPKSYERAWTELENDMAVVPAGEVVLDPTDDALEDGRLDDEELYGRRATVVAVDHFFLDRYPVTNRLYQEFVAAGGYEQANLWDPLILPALLDFVDSTGQPGPRFWKDGRYPQGEDDHPVVGVNWYEAQAYARWVGKRLPTDAEWTKAGSWPVRLSASSRVQRKFPWGNSMDRQRANLWGSGPGHTVSVREHTQGASVGGVYQLIGNVWEWTSGDFGTPGTAREELEFASPTKCLRGGAFDTYFDNQATCHFVSGDSPMARKPNIGFRCALSACDVGPGPQVDIATQATDTTDPTHAPSDEPALAT